jgi:hypothetical protein
MTRTLLILIVLFFPYQLALAADATAEQILAAEILNNDDDPNNNVTDASKIPDAAATISAASAAAIIEAITVTSGANPALAANIAKAGATYKKCVSDAESIANKCVSDAEVIANECVSDAAAIAAANAASGVDITLYQFANASPTTTLGGAGGNGGGTGISGSPS